MRKTGGTLPLNQSGASPGPRGRPNMVKRRRSSIVTIASTPAWRNVRVLLRGVNTAAAGPKRKTARDA
eukprot:3202810-Lingulodinium_polyedra.AAC.1